MGGTGEPSRPWSKGAEQVGPGDNLLLKPGANISTGRRGWEAGRVEVKEGKGSDREGRGKTEGGREQGRGRKRMGGRAGWGKQREEGRAVPERGRPVGLSGPGFCCCFY